MNSLKSRLVAFQRSRARLFIKKVLDDQVPNLGALVAWGTLSTLLPLLLGMLSLAGLLLRDHLLPAVRGDPHHSAARVGRPQRSIALSKDAFRPLQIVADVLKLLPIDSEIKNRIGSAHRRTPPASDALYAIDIALFKLAI